MWNKIEKIVPDPFSYHLLMINTVPIGYGKGFDTHNANASKLIENCFLDFRNILKIYLAKKIFLVLSIRKFILIEENGLKIKTLFLKQEIFSRLKKVVLIKRKFVLFWDNVLNSSQIFLQKGQKIFSQWVYFSCFEKNIPIFSCLWEQISQIKKAFLSKLWGICSLGLSFGSLNFQLY